MKSWQQQLADSCPEEDYQQILKQLEANTMNNVKTTPRSDLNSFNVRYETDHRLKEGAVISMGLNRYKIGSVAGSTAKENECPIKAVERAVKNGHELHFVFGLGAMLSATPRKESNEEYYGTVVAFGEDVYFAGRVFEFHPAPNQNIKLVEVVYPDPVYK